jgi:hypothetical protein
MESSARRVRAERNRRRLPQRGPASRWTRRVAGLLATAVFLGVGVVSVQMVLPDGDTGNAVISPAPAATPVKQKAKTKAVKAKAKKPKGLTKAQRQARTAAVAEVRRQGFTTIKLSDYDPKATLRVLIGRPVGDAGGGYQAFFFNKGAFLGKDALTPSTVLKISKSGRATVTLSYGVYAPGDSAGSPSARKRVRFKLVDGALTPQDTVPLQTARFQRPKG